MGGRADGGLKGWRDEESGCSRKHHQVSSRNLLWCVFSTKLGKNLQILVKVNSLEVFCFFCFFWPFVGKQIMRTAGNGTSVLNNSWPGKHLSVVSGPGECSAEGVFYRLPGYFTSMQKDGWIKENKTGVLEEKRRQEAKIFLEFYVKQ